MNENEYYKSNSFIMKNADIDTLKQKSKEMLDIKNEINQMTDIDLAQ